MTRIVFIGLLLLISITPAFASIFGDTNSNGQISSDELTDAILNHLDSGDSIPQDLSDAAWIYYYWNGSPLNITDTANRTITLDRPVRRLVVFDCGTLETLRSLNVTDLVVGVPESIHDEPTFFHEYQKTQSVGTVWSPDIEALMKTRPDTIFIYATFSEDLVLAIEEQVRAFDPSVRILKFDLFRPDVYQEEVQKVGKILGKDTETSEFLAFYESAMNAVQNRIRTVPDEKRRTVYFESWNAYKSAAPGSGYHEKVTFAGGNNIFAGAENSYPAVDPEAILKLKPDVIIKQVGAGESDVGGYNDPDSANLVTVYHDLLKRTGWDTLPAVQNNDVYIMSNDILGAASHFIGLQYLAKWLYPELFTDIDPLKTHQEYLERFQHLPFNPATHGGFVYP